MTNARAKRAKILVFTTKYANLWGFCCRRRRGCLSSLINMNIKLLTGIQDDFICCVEALPRYRIIRFELYPYVITSRSDVELFFLVATISIFTPQRWPRSCAIALVCHSDVIIGLAGLTPLQVKVMKCHLDSAVEHCVNNPTGTQRRKRRKEKYYNIASKLVQFQATNLLRSSACSIIYPMDTRWWRKESIEMHVSKLSMDLKEQSFLKLILIFGLPFHVLSLFFFLKLSRAIGLFPLTSTIVMEVRRKLCDL